MPSPQARLWFCGSWDPLTVLVPAGIELILSLLAAPRLFWLPSEHSADNTRCSVVAQQHLPCSGTVQPRAQGRGTRRGWSQQLPGIKLPGGVKPQQRVLGPPLLPPCGLRGLPVGDVPARGRGWSWVSFKLPSAQTALGFHDFGFPECAELKCSLTAPGLAHGHKIQTHFWAQTSRKWSFQWRCLSLSADKGFPCEWGSSFRILSSSRCQTCNFSPILCAFN